MIYLEAVAITVIGSMILYAIKRVDELDKRIDKLDKHLAIIQSHLPKRKTDEVNSYYSPNSGIEL